MSYDDCLETRKISFFLCLLRFCFCVGLDLPFFCFDVSLDQFLHVFPTFVVLCLVFFSTKPRDCGEEHLQNDLICVE